MITWIKQLFEMVRNYDKLKEELRRHKTLLEGVQTELRQTQRLIKSHYELSVDLGARGECDVILCGRLKGRDYVQTFRFYQEDFASIVENVRHLAKYAEVKRVDAPYGMHATVLRDFIG